MRQTCHLIMQMTVFSGMQKMNKDKDLQANLIIAKALGLPTEEQWTRPSSAQHYSMVRVPALEDEVDDPYFCGKLGYFHKEFNIFTNPSDCQAAVIHLGEKHGISIVQFISGAAEKKGYTYGLIIGGKLQGKRDLYPTYQDAVGAAYKHLEEQRSE